MEDKKEDKKFVRIAWRHPDIPLLIDEIEISTASRWLLFDGGILAVTAVTAGLPDSPPYGKVPVIVLAVDDAVYVMYADIADVATLAST